MNDRSKQVETRNAYESFPRQQGPRNYDLILTISTSHPLRVEYAEVVMKVKKLWNAV